MAHVQKFQRGAMGHMLSHYDRSKEITGGNIDWERTELNYNLATHQQNPQLDFVQQRLSEVKVQNRADVNIFCDWVVTAPKDLPEVEHKDFFQNTYNFLADRYGKENVISAYVHMDETTPHLHFAFVPVTYDQKHDRYKLSAKEVVTRYDLQTFHEDLSKHLEHYLGHEVGILNEATKEGNRSIEELKRETAAERLKEATQKASTIVSKAQEQVKAVESSIKPLQAEYEAKKAFIDQSIKESQASSMYPNYAKVKKSLFGKQTVTVPKEKWEQRHVSANQVSALRSERETLEKYIEAFKQSEPMLKIKSLEGELQQARQENLSLKKDLTHAEKQINRINKVFEKNPDIADQFFKAEKQIEKIMSRGWSR